MQVIFVHGWSVTRTDTYGGLPEALSAAAGTHGLDLAIEHIYLGRYISFHDEVTVDDISRAMDRALRDLPGNSDSTIAPFSCVTHSTGGPVVRHWVDRTYGAENLADLPLRHLVMLAPANHGSSLAKLGKARVGRIKSWFQGVEPGQRVLDWLCLGSDGQWSLNERALAYEHGTHDYYPFVLTGQGIDHKSYDFLNSYLVEKGSDGVVRVCGANMNHRRLSLVQSTTAILRRRPLTYALEPVGPAKTAKGVPLGVYRDRSHSGTKMGIMRSIKAGDGDAPVVGDILKCLQVDDRAAYVRRAEELARFTSEQQAGGGRYSMLVFSVGDDQGERIGGADYDLLLLAGKGYRPQKMPDGFLEDRQMNDQSGRLVYYLDAEKMSRIEDGKFGLRIVARPDRGFSYYCAGEFRSDPIVAQSVLAPNETTYVDIQLHRFVDENVFRFDPATGGSRGFKKLKPSGTPLENP